MKRKIATVAAVSSLALSPIATAAGNGGSNWNATHLPSPAPGYLPKQYPAPADVSAWDAQPTGCRFWTRRSIGSRRWD